MKKISIIVPVYNAERFLTRCVQSVLGQTYQNIELILVNDGSKDGSLALCNDLAKGDGRIIVIDKPNGGAASARNAGIAIATGEYIGFCDSDDYFDADMMATLVELLEKENLNTIECTSRALDEDGNVVAEDASDRALTKFSKQDAIKEIFFRRGNVHLATRLTRAEFIKKISIPEGRRVEDFYFTIALLLETDGTAVYNCPFYNYVVTAGSVTRSPGGSIYVDALYFYDKAVELLDGRGMDLAEAQEYYLMKMYYLLAISATRLERKKFAAEIKVATKYLRKNLGKVRRSAHLKAKEKLVLMISSISFGLARAAYCIKGGK